MAISPPRMLRPFMRVPVVRSIMQQGYESWLGLKYDLYRNYVKNPRSTRLYNDNKPQLNLIQCEVLEALNTRGIACVRFHDLFADGGLWERLQQEANNFATSQGVKQQEANYLCNYAEAAAKEYIIRWSPEHPTIPLANPWLQLAIQPPMLDLVNAYLGLWGKLNYVDLWYTIPLQVDRPAIGSQRWHRDPEDRKMLKAFLYCTDVDEGAGALEYIPASRGSGKYHSFWRHDGPNGQPRVPEDVIDMTIPPGERMKACGAAGTIMFCDTTGLHRGGMATQRTRLFATWAWVTPACLWPRRFEVDWQGTSASQLSHAAQFALSS